MQTHTGLRNAEVITCTSFLLKFKPDVYLSRTYQENNGTALGVCYTHQFPESQCGWGWQWPLKGPAQAQSPTAGCSRHVWVLWHKLGPYQTHTHTPSVQPTQLWSNSSSSVTIVQLSKKAYTHISWWEVLTC